MDKEKDPSYWVNMGYSLTAAGKHEPSKKYYEKALELDSKNQAALINLGNAQSSSGELDKAKRIYYTPLNFIPNLFKSGLI